METFDAALAAAASAVEATLDTVLPHGDGPEARLFEAMRYATLGGGKRLRPFLVMQGAKLFDVEPAQAARTGAAVELIHCYSLVHDDLPAMDDDELRRGRPTCHVQFDEATAILAGDALLTLAFAVLSAPETHPDPAVRIALVAALAKAAGALGMVGGQMFDLAAETLSLGLDEIKRLQRLKTGALFSFACEAGALLGRAPEKARQALLAYAEDLGLAFQIADDLLDAEGDEAEVGKKVGKDAALGKATFVSVLGIENARKEAQILAERAISRLDIFGRKAESLTNLARFVVERRA
ncbi:MAG TPA: farnesyl diphosphate synthase [Alphaproteobacteria bacterium]|nr:farnesyl diphosphate synthase [Alphaproteobacteria bacterium]